MILCSHRNLAKSDMKMNRCGPHWFQFAPLVGGGTFTGFRGRPPALAVGLRPLTRQSHPHSKARLHAHRPAYPSTKPPTFRKLVHACANSRKRALMLACNMIVCCRARIIVHLAFLRACVSACPCMCRRIIVHLCMHLDADLHMHTIASTGLLEGTLSSMHLPLHMLASRCSVNSSSRQAS